MSTSTAQTEHVYKTMSSPVGELKLVAGDRGLAGVLWSPERPGRGRAKAMREDARHATLVEGQRQLEEYFAGKRKKFELELDFVGTDFQKRVWNALLEIPFGETRTYGEIAKQLGDPKLMRAVGAANGQNPIPIIAPCHRVIGASGDLIGFGGGLTRKSQLLDLEQGKLRFNFAGSETAA